MRPVPSPTARPRRSQPLWGRRVHVAECGRPDMCHQLHQDQLPPGHCTTRDKAGLLPTAFLQGRCSFGGEETRVRNLRDCDWTQRVRRWRAKLSGRAAPRDGVSSHTHRVSAHTHGVSAHTHGVSSHTHRVSSHTHGVSSHTHGVSSVARTLLNKIRGWAPVVDSCSEAAVGATPPPGLSCSTDTQAG